MAVLMNGKEISTQVKANVAEEVKRLNTQGINPCLAVVIVGDNQASRVYVNNKKKACAEVGIISKEYALPSETTQEDLVNLVQELNSNDDVNGILVQLPLPSHIDEKAIIENIDPIKDVDAFHVSNVGKIMVGDFNFMPCTPSGVMELLKAYKIDVSGKNCVVIGRSNIVGKPMAMLLLHQNGTVTICHSKTNDLAQICKRVDILIAAVGKAGFVTKDMVKPGAIVVDV